MASAGQFSLQVPQETQLSVITNAMVLPPFYYKIHPKTRGFVRFVFYHIPWENQ